MSHSLGPLQDADTRLKQHFIELSRLWRSVREDWSDDRARAFEEQHLAELGPSLTRLSTAIAEFASAVRAAERALQDRDELSQDQREPR